MPGSASGAGYGNSAPNDCWGPIMVVTFQTLVGIFLDAVVIGIIFARISHPKCAISLVPHSVPIGTWSKITGRCSRWRHLCAHQPPKVRHIPCPSFRAH